MQVFIDIPQDFEHTEDLAKYLSAWKSYVSFKFNPKEGIAGAHCSGISAGGSASITSLDTNETVNLSPSPDIPFEDVDEKIREFYSRIDT